ncbi:MAG: ATP-binding protein [Chloroflexia bacterium]
MSEPTRHAEDNSRYLAASLAWLRLRLQRDPAGGGDCHSALPCHSERSEESQAAAAMRAAESAAESPPELVALSERLGLSGFERDLLLLCSAMEMDTRTAALCARAQDDPTRPYPTFALALSLFDNAAWDVLSPERPLRYWRLIEIHQPAGTPLTTSLLRADERIVNYLKGLNYVDDRIAPLLVPLEVGGGETGLPASQQAAVGQIIQGWRAAAPGALLPVVQLVGTDGPSKQLVALHAAAQFRRHLCRLPAELLPGQAGDLESLARLWQRESLLMPLALYLDAQETEPGPDGGAHPLSRFLARSDGLCFLAVREVWPRPGRAHIVLDVAKPTPAEQLTAWAYALGEQAADNPGRLAGQFNLNLTAISGIAGGALDQPPDDDPRPLADRLWDTCRAGVRPRLDALAHRIEPKATWDDIVLPAEQRNLLRQIAHQVGQRSRVYEDWGFSAKMNRGLGINALFAGDSGTGKTMAAEVIANDLRLNLYRIDLSAVVSKYIGETEKNLRRLFDAAEDGGAILFFDEADALFGKRSEVKDSHDRYANIEVNYLLQRMESYRGLAILATNMRNALDLAFMRRLRFIVDFRFPGPAERKRIWEKAFPPDTPTGPLDYDRLSRINLAGGSIHVIAINAAFLAAQADTPVTMHLVLAAARAEYRKLERPINEADFRWLEPAPDDEEVVA